MPCRPGETLEKEILNRASNRKIRVETMVSFINVAP
jgi:hypothetical protein